MPNTLIRPGTGKEGLIGINRLTIGWCENGKSDVGRKIQHPSHTTHGLIRMETATRVIHSTLRRDRVDEP